METKKCSKCRQPKLIGEFHLKKTENRYHAWCKECLYEYQKERWKNRKYTAVKLMGGKCFDCGYCKNYSALEFHHLDPNEKDFEWNKMRQLKWASIVEELKKCVLLCSNCHRERHYPESSVDCIDVGVSNTILQAEEIKPTGQCLLCGDFVYGTKCCSVECAHKIRRKVSRPNKTDLESLIKTNSFVAIGKMFGVSDNAVRKWAKTYKILPS
jgi:hypothetical protein